MQRGTSLDPARQSRADFFSAFAPIPVRPEPHHDHRPIWETAGNAVTFNGARNRHVGGATLLTVTVPSGVDGEIAERRRQCGHECEDFTVVAAGARRS
jgi:hypothetical protein